MLNGLHFDIIGKEIVLVISEHKESEKVFFECVFFSITQLNYVHLKKFRISSKIFFLGPQLMKTQSSGKI